MPTSCTYVALSSTGKVIPLIGADTDYYKVLLALQDRAGYSGVGDLARTLLCNGEVVIPNDLQTRANSYAADRDVAIAQAEANTKAAHRPDWLED